MGRPFRKERSRRTSRSLGASLLATGLVLLAAPVSQAVELSFVVIEREAPLRVRPPTDLADDTRLGLRIRDIQSLDSPQLVVQVLRKVDDPEVGTGPTKVRWDKEEMALRNLSRREDEIVVSVPTFTDPGHLQIQATLVGTDGSFLAPPSYVTLDEPSLIAQIFEPVSRWASAQLRQILYLSDFVRTSADGLAIFLIDVEDGKTGVLIKDLRPSGAEVNGLALSPSGNRLAWISSFGQGSRLWTLHLEAIEPRLVVDRPGRMVGPRFLDERRVIAADGGELIVVDVGNPVEMTLSRWGKGPVLTLYDARVAPGGSSVRLAAEVARTGDVSIAQSYVVALDQRGQFVSARRLPESALYALLNGETFDGRLYFRADRGGIAGVYFGSASEQDVHLVAQCEAVGSLAMSKNGRTLAVAAATCE